MTTEFREQEWTTRFLSQAFVWNNRTSPWSREREWFAGSARYGFQLYDIAGLRVERLCGRDMDRMVSGFTGVPDRSNLDSWYSRAYKVAYNQGLLAGTSYYFEITSDQFIATTVVSEIMNPARQDPTDPQGIRMPMDFHHLENMWFEFVGDARAYRNSLNMALFQCL